MACRRSLRNHARNSRRPPVPADRNILRDPPRRWISILHHNQTTTGVLRKNGNNAIFNFALAYERFDLVGDFVGAFP